MIPEIKKHEETNTDKAIAWLQGHSDTSFLLIIPDKNGPLSIIGLGTNSELLGSLDLAREFFLHPSKSDQESEADH